MAKTTSVKLPSSMPINDDDLIMFDDSSFERNSSEVHSLPHESEKSLDVPGILD